MASTKADHYEVLGVAKEASADEVRAAYKKLALQWHPDKNPNDAAEAEIMFKKVSHAYRVLSDVSKRKAYDTKRKDYDTYTCTSDDTDDEDDDHPFMYGFRVNLIDLLNMFERMEMDDIFSRHGRGRTAQPNRFKSSMFHGHEHEDFTSHGGRNKQRTKKVPKKPPPRFDQNGNDVNISYRKVNGEKWMTKTYVDAAGRTVIERYVNGEMVDKKIDGESKKKKAKQ